MALNRLTRWTVQSVGVATNKDVPAIRFEHVR